MINQQLIDFINQQLALGSDRDAIKKALMSQNWVEQDINEGFVMVDKIRVGSIPQTPVPSGSSVEAKTSIWAKGIPRTNYGFMVVSLLLVFGLDLFVIISSPDLKEFWYVMLIVLAVFTCFLCIENFVFSKRLASTKSGLDKWISMVIVIRNLIFLLNFIPFIQLLGLAAIFFGGWIILLAYIILMVSRFSQAR